MKGQDTEEPMETTVLCGANATNMKFYFNEERYGILPKAVKEELRVLCVLYCSDVGGAITLSFDETHRLRITTLAPIDEIGAELKVKAIQQQYEELFSMLEEFSRQFDGAEEQ
ncbi:MAG: DUF6145 family protein [Eubacteriales bacterium]|nr:DUF6145 family protein [Eubacteriales bacterium]